MYGFLVIFIMKFNVNIVKFYIYILLFGKFMFNGNISKIVYVVIDG